MIRLIAFLAAIALSVSACGAPGTVAGGNAFRISSGDTAKIQYRTLDSVNSYRTAAGLPSVQLSAELTAAAQAHSRDMSQQNRPWHWGSDGSSIIDRARRAGYPGSVLRENIAETYESDVETLAAWMTEDPATRNTIMDPEVRDLGFGWYQEKNGKIWWTLMTGG